jgi:hypothetical protein
MYQEPQAATNFTKYRNCFREGYDKLCGTRHLGNHRWACVHQRVDGDDPMQPAWVIAISDGATDTARRDPWAPAFYSPWLARNYIALKAEIGA